MMKSKKPWAWRLRKSTTAFSQAPSGILWSVIQSSIAIGPRSAVSASRDVTNRTRAVIVLHAA